jgi:hypothetical protein
LEESCQGSTLNGTTLHDTKTFQEVEQRFLRYKTMNLIVEKQFLVERLHGLKMNEHPFFHHSEDDDKKLYFLV